MLVAQYNIMCILHCSTDKNCIKLLDATDNINYSNMTQDDFNNLSKEKLIEGLELSYENADNLFTAARELSAKDEMISYAISLMILSAEEASKAIIFYTKYIMMIKEKSLMLKVYLVLTIINMKYLKVPLAIL